MSAAALPPVVQRLAAGRPVRAVWRNELGDCTYRVASGAEFIKVAARDSADFANEARRLGWAERYVAVPPVLDHGVDGGCAGLRTLGLPGVSAVPPRWQARPAVAVRAIGVGLRSLHDSLPVSSCPFDWSVNSRLPVLHPAHRAHLPEPPPIDRLVVCHGDACAPNTLIDDRGQCCGHVDFGELGVADRWADLAGATLSLGWNYPGRSWEADIFAAYGIEPDLPRIDYYRRLWQDPDL